jgi:hypothetical protein
MKMRDADEELREMCRLEVSEQLVNWGWECLEEGEHLVVVNSMSVSK